MDPSLVRALRAIVGARNCLEDAARRIAYESDGLALLRRVPELVVLPRDSAQTAAVLRACAEAGVPIVPRGAGTGLAGGATPVEGGVVIGTSRMRDVLELAPAERFARVQAGVVNADLSRLLEPHGLFYAPDPSSQKACTLGGNVANNSGGPHCFFHGATTRHVLGLVVALPDGELLELRGPELDPAGYDLIGAFVGSEGLLGIATEATLKLVPLPEAVETLLAVYPALEPACEAVSALIAARLEPSAIEILDRLTIEAVEASVYAAGYPRDAGAVLLVELEGSRGEVALTAAEVEAILRAHGASELRRGRDPAERARLWAGRKGAFGAMGRIAPDLYVADVVVPRTQLAALVRLATEACTSRGLKVANVFHAGDGNLHPNVSYDRRDADEVARVLAATDEIMEAVVAAGGALSGEHGVGLEKLAGMELLFGADDLRAMCRLKAAFDPAGRMNPGKLLPTRACREVPAPARTLPGAAERRAGGAR